MAEHCTFRVDGQLVGATQGESLAVALLRAGYFLFRKSCSGQARAPVCCMGTCYECQVSVNGVPVRACLEPVRASLEVRTDG